MKELPSPEIFEPARVIGIDPGISTGVSILDVKAGQILTVHTLTFWAALDLIESYSQLSTFIVIEDSSHQKKLWSANRKTPRQAAAVGRSVGSNNREASLLADGLERAGYYVMSVKPRNTKLKSGVVESITGFTGKTNEHNRDACLIAWSHRSPAVIKGLVKSIYTDQLKKRAG